jgi:thiosulfate/3-mercaptopyruvate sulfurtransferase
LLDGGIDEWLRVGGCLTHEIPPADGGTFRAQILADRRVTGDWLLDHLNDPGVQIVDNRSPEEYMGQDVYARRDGHIPGARLCPWDLALNADLTFKRREALEAIYQKIGLDFQKTTINYCQSGVRSTHAYFTQRLLGFRDPRVYDGSWAEWGNDDRFPIEQ